MDREACHAAVHGVAKSWTQPSNWTELTEKDSGRQNKLEFGSCHKLFTLTLWVLAPIIVSIIIINEDGYHLPFCKIITASWFGILVKNLPASRRCRFDPFLRTTPWRSIWQPPPVFLSRKFHGQRNLVGYKESDTTVGLSSLIRAGDTCFASVWTQSYLHSVIFC